MPVCSAARNSSEPVLIRATPRAASSGIVCLGWKSTLTGASISAVMVEMSESGSPGTNTPSAPAST